MRDNSRRVCEVMEEFAIQHDFLINIGSDKASKVADLIAHKQPQIFVELGGYLGYSAILFADQMRRSHPPDKKLQYWSIDLNPLFASITMNLVDLAGLSDIVKVVRSTIVMPVSPVIETRWN